MKYAIGPFVFTMLISTLCIAQKPVIEGDFTVLKEQKKINVEFTYDNMSVGDFEKESDYVMEIVNERNEEEAGSGDEWKMRWESDRAERFEPKFVELFNKQMEDRELAVEAESEALYTLRINTDHTEPGWNAGVMRRSAHINVTIELIESGSEKESVGLMRLKKVPGRDVWGFDFDTGKRLEEAYAMTGKIFAKYLDKKVLR